MKHIWRVYRIKVNEQLLLVGTDREMSTFEQSKVKWASVGIKRISPGGVFVRKIEKPISFWWKICCIVLDFRSELLGVIIADI